MPVQTYKFGTGSLFGMKTGGAGPNTPLMFGALQDVSVDFQFTVKGLRGQKLFSLANAQGEGKVTGKAAWAQVNGQIYNDLFFNGTLAQNSGLSVSVTEAATVPSTTPYTVTVANATKLQDDLGVAYLTGGNPFTKASAPAAAGQYSESAGTYTFDASDAGTQVLISYTYTNTTGNLLTITNQLQGQAPLFSIWFATMYNGQQAMFKLPACTASKLTLASKMGDWNIDNFEFEAQDDGSGNIAYLSQLT